MPLSGQARLLCATAGEALEFAGPSDVFEEANKQAGHRVYDIRFVAEETQPITCLSGLRVMPDRTIHDADEPIDTLIVTGARDPFGPTSPALIDWPERQAPTTRRYGAVCSGASLLGAAGLLDTFPKPMSSNSARPCFSRSRRSASASRRRSPQRWHSAWRPGHRSGVMPSSTRLPHADQIRRQAAPERRHRGNDVAPEIR
jgi:putative intracellular protease/amidase